MIQIKTVIIYLNNENCKLKKNSEIEINNLLKSKELNELNQKKIYIQMQENDDNYWRLKNKIDFQEKISHKYYNEMEKNSNEIFINQLLDLYNLKKLNEMI